MKLIYKTGTGISYCLIILSFMTACNSSLTYNEALRKNEKKTDSPAKLEDAKFLMDAESYNMLATQLSEAAMTKGYAASVVQLAKENHDAYEQMGKEIRKLARQQKVVLSATMKEEHQELLNELTRSDRKDFDKTFIRIFRSVSEEDNTNFMRMATDAADDDVRAFAARNLDRFKSHETQFETVDAELLKTY